MKTFGRVAMIVALLVGTAVLAAATSIEKILEYHWLDEVEVSPDGRGAVFVATVADLDENVMNSDLWLVDYATGGSFQLTRGPKRDNHPRWSPDGRTIAFLSNRAGKNNNIWLISAEGGEAWPATEFEKLSVSDFEWLPNASGFIFTAPDPKSEEEEKREEEKKDPILVDKNFKYTRLYRFHLGDEEPTKLTEEDYDVTSFSVSPDGAWVAFSARPTPKVPDYFNSDLKLLELETGTIRALVTQPGADSNPKFSPDGEWIAFVSGGGRYDWIGNSYLYVVRPDGSGLRNISQGFDERIGGFFGDFEWSPDGESIYYQAGQGVAFRLFRIQVATGKYEPVSVHDQRRVMHGFGVSRDGGTIALTVSDPESPAELYRLDTSAGSLEKLTEVNADFIGTGPQVELLRYRSRDGLDLEGLVLKPRDYQEGQRYPLLVVIHGGPAGVFMYRFAPRRGAYPLHAFTEQGYVVFLPNPRGSGFYGERFRRANFRDWGYGDYRDIMQGIDLLIQQGVADPERMGVMGWSYGGYMTSWIVTQTDRFRAASIGAAVTNAFSFYGTTDIPEFMEAYYGGKPWEDARNYLRHSAMNFAGNAKTPALIQHGKEDRRVPLSQGEEFYMALKKVGVPVEMVVYPRQPHGIREPRLLKDALERNLHWFNKWLLGLEPPKEKEESEKESEG